VKIYLVAGEASGDARGAELMRALRECDPSIEFFGAGGREMRALAGGDFLDWADEAVVGLWDVLKKYGYFKTQFDRMLAEIAHLAPAAVIFIDYPGFNLRLAKAVKARLPAVRTMRAGCTPSSSDIRCSIPSKQNAPARNASAISSDFFPAAGTRKCAASFR
jgi:lipid A disaccharide synthetase